MARFLYCDTFKNFLSTDSEKILGVMTLNNHGDLKDTTKYSWENEIEIIKETLDHYKGSDGKVIFEYNIPRLSKRIDVVILFKGIIFCLEFKVGKPDNAASDLDQVLDYALDLNNFHKYSENKIIAPILIPTKTKIISTCVQKSAYSDQVLNPMITNEKSIHKLIDMITNEFPKEKPLNEKWDISPYYPTPTIIEAAKALYNNHSVDNITHHGASKKSTTKTIKYILEVIQKSKKEKQKSICFVTGVPGAGKTLVGLDVAIKQTYQGKKTPVKDDGAVYLSGNGPLVAVLKEALARDNVKQSKEKKIQKNISDARREVGKSIQMIHNYRDNMLAKIKTPIVKDVLEIDPKKAVKLKDSGYAEVEHVAIFDEAQRSWTHKRLADYLKRGGTYGNKLKVANFPMSEAAFLIWALDQRKDWATIVCLVGGGQEINKGEAGISEWIKALNEKFPNWKVYISPNLKDKEYAEGHLEKLLSVNPNVAYSTNLHLSVNLRSFKANKLSEFVNAMLNFNSSAKDLYLEIQKRYPLLLTRDINKAKNWLHKQARGSTRTGVLVSKESARYKPLSIHILNSHDQDAVHWFLDDKNDIRSSNFLEDAATEIQVQGLELDYTCLLWDADMRYQNGTWHYYSFNGSTEWKEQFGKSATNAEKIQYMFNAYRVLLTRARSGMIICVPFGNSNKTASGNWEDKTRLPAYYDGTYNYLKSLGIKEI